AGVILNEVVSRNPSLLLGQQEVFGMAADLILANPNGISCQGCGFINTNNAGLIVGNPLIENGMISAYSTLDNTSSLTIGNNGITTGKVLDLVAPAINADGEIRAVALNVITGNNTVSADMQTISAGKNAVPLDSYY
ncbi:filamentous hemagglutinin N-terminal domain-containing protein, partial [Klebsiella pneumoniae]|nr:filamentous hemagglutinin N-terminal domain-containing protein [Klebsiella pneumoniae]